MVFDIDVIDFLSLGARSNDIDPPSPLNQLPVPIALGDGPIRHAVPFADEALTQTLASRRADYVLWVSVDLTPDAPTTFWLAY